MGDILVRKRRTLLNPFYVFSFITLLLVFISACKTEKDISSHLKSTKDPDSLRPALFKAEDLDWPQNQYKEVTENLWVIEDQVPADDMMEADTAAMPDPFARGKSPTNRYIAYQTLYKYSDEETAIKAYAKEAERYVVGMGPFPENVYFIPKLNNLITGCRNSYSPEELGYYRTCEFLGQHGRYMTVAYMVVDDKVIQIKDWDNLINAVQDRLMAHVEQEELDK